MTTPEALRLAYWLEGMFDPTYNQRSAAALLRRQHAEIERLTAERDELTRQLHQAAATDERVRRVRAEDSLTGAQTALQAALALPRKGTPAAELTERDKLALCVAAGAPVERVLGPEGVILRTRVPCGVADRGDGGYIVVVGLQQSPVSKL